MKPLLARRLATGLLLAVVGAATLVAPAPASAQELDVKEVKLDNGMTVLLYRRPGDPNVAAGWIAHVGSVNEWPGITGLSHLFEHMMFKGTRTIGTKDIEADIKLNAEQDRIRGEIRKEQDELDRKARLGLIEDAKSPAARSERHQKLLADFDALVKKQKDLLVDNEFDAIYTKAGGSGMNAFTNYDVTCYFVNIPANKLELWFWLESDRLMNPIFRQFYSERDVVWEERRMRTDSTPTGKLDELFESMFWNASPYSWPVIGWPSDLDGITREEANAYFDRNYSPNNLTAALVGDFDMAEGERLARQYFGRLKRNPLDPAPMKTFEVPMLGVRRFEAEAETRPTVNVRWFGVPHSHVDEAPLSVLTDLLNGETGRLEMSLVKNQKIASTANASQDARKYAGYIEVTAVAAPEKSVEDLEAAVYREIQRLQDEVVPAEELQKVKNRALADKYRRLDSNFFIMLQLLVYDALSDWRTMTKETDHYLAVTPQDVQRVAKKYLDMGTRTVAVYRTKKGAGEADPLWDALNPMQQQIASQIKGQVSGETDPAELEKALGQIAAQRGAVPVEQKEMIEPVFAWAESYIKNRIATLKGGGK
jgi:predicted Zn-dependent peptidase